MGEESCRTGQTRMRVACTTRTGHAIAVCALVAGASLALSVGRLPAAAATLGTTFNVVCGDVAGLDRALRSSASLRTINLNSNNVSGCTYVLTSVYPDGWEAGLPVLQNEATINGNGSTLARQSTTAFRILSIETNATVSLQGLTITGGLAPSHVEQTPDGGSSLIQGFGGGIYNFGTLRLTRCVVRSNTVSVSSNTVSVPAYGYGGGIYNGGTMTLSRTTVSGNVVSGDFVFGGGIENPGTLVLDGSVVSSNSALSTRNYAIGGGVDNGGTTVVINSTITGNTPDNCAGMSRVLGCSNVPL